MADFYRDVIRLLREAGYELKRQGRGDHEIWWNPQTRVHVTVDHKLKSRFTANGILQRSKPSQGVLNAHQTARAAACVVGVDTAVLANRPRTDA